MIKEVVIEVDLVSLEKRIQITGNICFTIDYHHYFPEQDWSDFVVIILSWWIKSCKGIIISEIGRTYNFDFIDGSLIVIAKKISSDIAELSFYENNSSKVLFKAECSINQLRDSLLSTSKKVLRAIDREKWQDDDSEELKDLVNSLDKYPF
ncbi:hypothetical protein [Psychrobacillus sp. NPDC096389]|uniref:hypothetical protein n=1 Tax=Psychrobacillus sp. NPDC096389 TaxID=3364490 RepID=UPI0038219724